MLAFSPIPMFDRMDHPSVPTTFLGARRLVAVKDGREATAKRRPASLRATKRYATLATGGHSVTPLPDTRGCGTPLRALIGAIGNVSLLFIDPVHDDAEEEAAEEIDKSWEVRFPRR